MFNFLVFWFFCNSLQSSLCNISDKVGFSMTNSSEPNMQICISLLVEMDLYLLPEIDCYQKAAAIISSESHLCSRVNKSLDPKASLRDSNISALHKQWTLQLCTNGKNGQFCHFNQKCRYGGWRKIYQRVAMFYLPGQAVETRTAWIIKYSKWIENVKLTAHTSLTVS